MNNQILNTSKNDKGIIEYKGPKKLKKEEPILLANQSPGVKPEAVLVTD